MCPNKDEDVLFGGDTSELMTGWPAVRVLVTDTTSAGDAVRVLRKIVKLIESNRSALIVWQAVDDQPGDVDIPF